MKPSVAIALIICGTVLILSPLIHSAVLVGMAAWVMAFTHQDVKLSAHPPNYYYVACLIAGIAMVAIGTARALKSKHQQ
jgi:hypothetical protein